MFITIIKKLFFKYKTRNLYCLLDSIEFREESFALGDEHFDKKLKRGGLIKGGHIISCVNRRNNKVIGVMQFFTVEELKQNKAFEEEYQSLDYIPEALLPYTLVGDTVYIDKKQKDSKYVSIMLMKTYLEFFYGNQYNISVGICEPVLYPIYKQLFMFKTPTKLIKHPDSGFYVVMVSTRKDYEESKNVQFLIDLIRYDLGDRYQSIPQDIDAMSENIRHEEHSGIKILTPKEIDKLSFPLLQGLTLQTRQELFKNSVVVTSDHRDSIMKEDDGSQAMMIVKTGKCAIVAKDRVITDLGEGSLVGVFAYILNQPRSTTVYSASDYVELIILAKNCMTYISDPEQKTKIWMNIARELALIIIQMNNRLLGTENK